MRSCRTHHDTSPLISVPGILPILSPSHMMTTKANLPQNLFAVCFLRTIIHYMALTLRRCRLALRPSICCSRPYPTLGKTAALASNIIMVLLIMPIRRAAGPPNFGNLDLGPQLLFAPPDLFAT